MSHPELCAVVIFSRFYIDLKYRLNNFYSNTHLHKYTLFGITHSKSLVKGVCEQPDATYQTDRDEDKTDHDDHLLPCL